MTYATDAIAQLDRVTTQAELDAIAPIVTGALGAQISAAGAAEAIVGPLAALATASFSTLPQVVTFLQSIQTAVLGPQAAAAAKLVANGVAATAALAAVNAAIAAAEARINA